jgi:hypothetical protein
MAFIQGRWLHNNTIDSLLRLNRNCSLEKIVPAAWSADGIRRLLEPWLLFVAASNEVDGEVIMNLGNDAQRFPLSRLE